MCLSADRKSKLRVLTLPLNHQHKHSVFLHVLIVCLFVYWQGEKGEPASFLADDGTMMSSLVGPVGPKGLKVILVLLSSDSSPPLYKCVFLSTGECLCVYRGTVDYLDLLGFK